MSPIGKIGLIAAILFVAALTASAQTKAPVGKTLFYDSDGNLISNNEFVDIRMANPNYPDRTLMKTLDDGTVEFRLQKIPQEGSKAPEFSLKTIDGKTVKFYEAVATLKEQRPAIATSFAGQFDFTGEGQNWQKVMTFTRTGDALKRAEEEGTFTYKRCA